MTNEVVVLLNKSDFTKVKGFSSSVPGTSW